MSDGMKSKTAHRIVNLEYRLRGINAFEATYLLGALFKGATLKCGLSSISIDREFAKKLLDEERRKVVDELKSLEEHKQ